MVIFASGNANNIIFIAMPGVILIIIALIIESQSSGKSEKSEKISTIQSEKSYKTIMGMIKLEKKLDLKEASELSGYSKKDLKQLIYTLAADDKIDGTFEGEVFVINSGIDTFIELLDKEFTSWEAKETDKVDKMEFPSDI